MYFFSLGEEKRDPSKYNWTVHENAEPVNRNERAEVSVFLVCVCIISRNKREKNKAVSQANERKNYFNDSKCFAYRTSEKKVPACNEFIQLLWKRVIATRQQNTAGKANENELSYRSRTPTNQGEKTSDICKWRESEIRLNVTNQRNEGILVDLCHSGTVLVFFFMSHLSNII